MNNQHPPSTRQPSAFETAAAAFEAEAQDIAAGLLDRAEVDSPQEAIEEARTMVADRRRAARMPLARTRLNALRVDAGLEPLAESYHIDHSRVPDILSGRTIDQYGYPASEEAGPDRQEDPVAQFMLRFAEAVHDIDESPLPAGLEAAPAPADKPAVEPIPGVPGGFRVVDEAPAERPSVPPLGPVYVLCSGYGITPDDSVRGFIPAHHLVGLYGLKDGQWLKEGSANIRPGDLYLTPRADGDYDLRHATTTPPAAKSDLDREVLKPTAGAAPAEPPPGIEKHALYPGLIAGGLTPVGAWRFIEMIRLGKPVKALMDSIDRDPANYRPEYHAHLGPVWEISPGEVPADPPAKADPSFTAGLTKTGRERMRAHVRRILASPAMREVLREELAPAEGTQLTYAGTVTRPSNPDPFIDPEGAHRNPDPGAAALRVAEWFRSAGWMVVNDPNPPGPDYTADHAAELEQALRAVDSSPTGRVTFDGEPFTGSPMDAALRDAFDRAPAVVLRGGDWVGIEALNEELALAEFNRQLQEDADARALLRGHKPHPLPLATELPEGVSAFSVMYAARRRERHLRDARDPATWDKSKNATFQLGTTPEEHTTEQVQVEAGPSPEAVALAARAAEARTAALAEQAAAADRAAEEAAASVAAIPGVPTGVVPRVARVSPPAPAPVLDTGALPDLETTAVATPQPPAPDLTPETDGERQLRALAEINNVRARVGMKLHPIEGVEGMPKFICDRILSGLPYDANGHPPRDDRPYDSVAIQTTEATALAEFNMRMRHEGKPTVKTLPRGCPFGPLIEAARLRHENNGELAYHVPLPSEANMRHSAAIELLDVERIACGYGPFSSTDMLSLPPGATDNILAGLPFDRFGQPLDPKGGTDEVGARTLRKVALAELNMQRWDSLDEDFEGEIELKELPADADLKALVADAAARRAQDEADDRMYDALYPSTATEDSTATAASTPASPAAGEEAKAPMTASARDWQNSWQALEERFERVVLNLAALDAVRLNITPEEEEAFRDLFTNAKHGKLQVIEVADQPDEAEILARMRRMLAPFTRGGTHAVTDPGQSHDSPEELSEQQSRANLEEMNAQLDAMGARRARVPEGYECVRMGERSFAVQAKKKAPSLPSFTEADRKIINTWHAVNGRYPYTVSEWGAFFRPTFSERLLLKQLQRDRNAFSLGIDPRTVPLPSLDEMNDRRERRKLSGGDLTADDFAVLHVPVPASVGAFTQELNTQIEQQDQTIAPAAGEGA